MSEGELRNPLVQNTDQRILQDYSNGYTLQAIADRAGLSKDTVRRHLHSIRARLGAASNSQAVAIALRNGFIK